MHAELNMNVGEQVLNGIHSTCPAVLVAAMKEARSSDADMGKIARFDRAGCRTVRPMLKLANSPYFGLRNKASSIQQAVVVLGLRNTLNHSAMSHCVPMWCAICPVWMNSGIVPA